MSLKRFFRPYYTYSRCIRTLVFFNFFYLIFFFHFNLEGDIFLVKFRLFFYYYFFFLAERGRKPAILRYCIKKIFFSWQKYFKTQLNSQTYNKLTLKGLINIHPLNIFQEKFQKQKFLLKNIWMNFFLFNFIELMVHF